MPRKAWSVGIGEGGGLKKGVAAGGCRDDVGEAGGVNEDGVAIPEVDGGKVASEDLLGFGVVGASMGGV